MDIASFLSQQPLLTTALIVISVVLIGNEIVIALRSGFKLLPGDAVRLMNDRDPLVVDVRSLADFKKGHIIGAKNLPISRLAEADKELGAPTALGDRPLLVYCALGTAAGSAREKLLKQGYSDVLTLRGGLNNWQASNLPLTKPEKSTKATRAQKKGGKQAAKKKAA